MRICFLSSLHPPTDKRVFDKEAISLASAGFEVIHVAPGSAGDVTKSGVRILTQPSLRGIAGRILNGPRLFQRARKVNADCYHCNEVDSWIIGIGLKVVSRCKVVFDAHEAYPEGFAESRFPQILRPAVASSLRLLFRFLMLFTDRVVLAKESIAGDYPNTTKHVLVRNYVSAAYANRNIAATPRSRKPGSVRVIHLGLISRLRGWEHMIEAIGSSRQPFEMVFVGTFNDGSEPAFRARVTELGIEDRIQVIPWLPFDEAYREVCTSDVGVIAFQPGTCNHVKALPHKMFDYMAAAIPVVAPEFAVEVSRIVRDADCGLLVDPQKPESIRDALETLATHPEERIRLGENGRNAVRHLFNWENEVFRLETMYRELSIDCSRSPRSRDAASLDK